jgi:hypothetical protein
MTLEEALAEEGMLSGPFDLVCALFGAASYLTPAAITELPTLCPGGLIVLMNYEEGYVPDYEIGEVDEHALAAARLAARKLRRDHFGVAVGIGRFEVTLAVVEP